LCRWRFGHFKPTRTTMANGAIVMTESIAGYEGQIGQSDYAAAKAGAIGLTIALARDLSSAGIRINTIAPGAILTPKMASVGEQALAHFVQRAVPETSR
jgi:NAD(P)-dependent dehydrogenase (short-subunit alcohol dehydrogenase family)